MSVLREFRLPDLGEGLTESDIVAWKVAAGDRVELNQIIAEVETAKALVELPSPFAGVVAQLHALAGATVNVGEPLVTFEVSGPEGGSPEGAAPAPVAASPANAPSSAVATPAPTPTAPTPVAPLASDGIEPNLVGYGAQPERSGRPTRRARVALPAAAALSVPATAAEGSRARSTPPVRRLAQQLGVDLARVLGTGEGGLITREDVEGAAGSGGARGASATPLPAFPLAPAPLTGRSARPRELRTPIRGVRKHTAATVSASAFTAPHVTEFLTIDVTPSMELIERLAVNKLSAGVRVTVLALVAHAVCIVLDRHPTLNSSWDEAAQEIVQYGYVNLGIAAATERGLVVPNIKDAQSLSLLEIAQALTALTQDARAGRLTSEQLSGGTITITNVGVFGIDAGTPILNTGEAAILALGAVRRRPWEHQGEIALRQIVTLSLSFDHRLVDGEQASLFLSELGALLADPGLALLLTGS
jgi:2-oxoisovalerate dehydrogenase E2 component (dihydrolipoyl transacylase)